MTVAFLFAAMVAVGAVIAALAWRHEPSAPRTPEQRRAALARSGLWFALIAPNAYLAQRVPAILRHPPPSQPLILATTHVPFFWRVAIAAWIGALGAAIAYRAKRPARPAILAAAIGASALLFAAVAAWRP